ncbi:MAG TPA: efflux RND transporter periplasmic adaptor subunit [Sandaracinaceae bacterium LLY-WYZ-13_1]|nr:efflux RND transporter periplasmic adaptor subunit [Sandaracinaceae bacterium LLY-WYZ-13_1]
MGEENESAHGDGREDDDGKLSRFAERLRRALPFALLALLIGCPAFFVGRCSAPDDEDTAHVHEAGGEDTVWTCSMHPQIRQPEPGQCPICGMDLIPVGDDGATRPGPDQVTLSERARALARVRTTRVRRLDAGGAAVRLLGRIDVDETTRNAITSWIPGRIDRLHVDVTGERVRRGQIVATLYSPEVYAAQQDLITARRQLDRLQDASELARSSARASVAAARQRLSLLGIPSAEIDRMARASRPSRHVAIRATASGTVIERLATEGAYVETGEPLYRVANLEQLWVQLDAYESDLPHLTEGQTVTLEVEALPGEVFEGRVAFIDPVIDARRRTARVRVSVSNEGGRLRPGMFVEAVVRGAAEGEASQPLVVPASAPLFTGRRSVVYVELPDAPRPTYEARVVRLGSRTGDLYPVVAGLSEGERVVTHGAFALDADLQIRGGRSMMTRGDDSSAGPYELAMNVPEPFREGLRTVVAPYLVMQQRLAADDEAAAKEAALAMLGAVNEFAPTEPAPAVNAWRPIAGHLRVHTQRAADADAIEGVRAQFEPLSDQIAHLLRLFGNPMETPLRLAHCPMAFDDRGAEWVQSPETIDNAYFGAAMRTCGSIEATVEPGSYLPGDPDEAPPTADPAIDPGDPGQPVAGPHGPDHGADR